MVGEKYAFSPSGTYITPDCQEVEGFLDLIRNLPLVPQPEIFGLHANADITCDQNETYAIFETVLSLQPRVSSGGGLAREDVIEAAAKEIMAKYALLLHYLLFCCVVLTCSLNLVFVCFDVSFEPLYSKGECLGDDLGDCRSLIDDDLPASVVFDKSSAQA